MDQNNNKIDDIYALLDEVARQKAQQTQANQESDLASMNRNINHEHIVQKPILAKVDDFTSRLDCFTKIVENVDYGQTNANEYVNGHQEVLKKYLQAAQDGEKFWELEEKVNDEISEYARADKRSIYIKAYYDGLVYVYKALKKSKSLMAERIYERLKRGLA